MSKNNVKWICLIREVVIVQTQKYSVNQYLIETVLAWVKSGEIAIPEIQRPFVWDASKSEGFNGFIVSGLPYRLYNYMEKSEYQA